MRRFCIKKEKIEDISLENNSIIRIDPFILLEACKDYIPSQTPNDVKLMEEKKPPLPNCVREEILKFTIEASGLSKEEYEKSQYDNSDKDNLPIFPECEAAMMRLVSMASNNDNTVGEEEMYGDILQDSFSTVLVELDMYLHIYYTLLYEKNKDTYVPLFEKDWSKDKKTDMRNKRKECKRALNKGQRRKAPFEIIENVNSRKSSTEKLSYDPTMIQDFAPNICRLYYLSPKFRNIFASVKKSDANKYKFSEIKKLFQEADINRKEEVWLCEELLGINLSLAFYSFFSAILKDINYTTIEKDYAGVIQGIIKEVMSLEGIYSRCTIVHKLKIIYELKKKSSLYTSYDTPKKHLYYLYKHVLCQYMPECVKRYKYMECCALEKYEENDPDKVLIMEKVEKDCEVSFSKYFDFIDGYYLIKELSKEIKDEKLYALIQRIVINNK